MHPIAPAEVSGGETKTPRHARNYTVSRMFIGLLSHLSHQPVASGQLALKELWLTVSSTAPSHADSTGSTNIPTEKG